MIKKDYTEQPMEKEQALVTMLLQKMKDLDDRINLIEHNCIKDHNVADRTTILEQQMLNVTTGAKRSERMIMKRVEELDQMVADIHVDMDFLMQEKSGRPLEIDWEAEIPGRYTI